MNDHDEEPQAIKEVEETNEQKSLDRKKTYRRIAYITIPAFLELFLSSALGAVDGAMVGRLGEAEFAGVGLTNQPFFLLISVFSAVNVGVTTLVSWSIGKGQKKEAGEILKQTLLFNFIIGLILSVVGYMLSPYIIGAMGGFLEKNTDMIFYGTTYMRALSFGIVFQAVNMAITAALRGAGESFLPLMYNLFSNGVNIVFNYLLIFGHFGFPKMGVFGAGLATTISRMVGTCMALYVVFLWKKSPIHVQIGGSWRINKKILKEIFRIGLPASAESLVVQVGLMIFTGTISSLGPLLSAAHQVGMQINRIVFSVSQAFQVSTTTLVGQAVGAKDYDSIDTYVKLNIRAARIISMVVAVFCIVFSEPLSLIFTSNPAVIEAARPLFIFIAIIKFPQSSQMSTSGALRGVGDTIYPLYATIFGVWVFRVGLTLLLVRGLGLGLLAAWVAFLCDQLCRTFIVRRRYTSNKWKLALMNRV